MPVIELPLDDSRYLTGLKSVIEELAASSSVVVRGRGSQFILKNHANSTHVLLVAPMELRIRRVMETFNFDERAAREEISFSDSSHREFIKKYFKADIEDPENYDLVLNTGRISYENAATIVADAVRLSKQT